MIGAAQIAMLAAQLGPAVWQFVQGAKQAKQGKQMAAGIQDPIMPIPESATSYLGGARNLASSREMAGQTAMEGRIDRQVANATSDAVRGATSSQDLLGAVTGITDRAIGQEADMAVNAARDYQGRQRDYMGALQFMSGLEKEKWTNDVLNKFLRDSATASSLQNAGMINQYQGFKGGMGALGSFAGNNAGDINAMFKGDEARPQGDYSTIQSRGTDNLAVPSFQANTQPSGSVDWQKMIQQMGQQQYGSDWSNFLNSMNFQANPSFK